MKDYTVYFIYLGLTCTKTDFFKMKNQRKRRKKENINRRRKHTCNWYAIFWFTGNQDYIRKRWKNIYETNILTHTGILSGRKYR